MNRSTEQLRARMAAELDELGPMPDVSARAAREGGRILRRRRLAAGSMVGVAGIGACSLLGAVASGALPREGGRVADHSTPRPVPSQQVTPPQLPIPSQRATPVPSQAPMPEPTPVLPVPALPVPSQGGPSPAPSLPVLPELPQQVVPTQVPRPSPRPLTRPAPTVATPSS